MNLYICGFIDIVLITSFIAFIIIGYKEGFLTKFLELAKGLGGIVLAFFLVVPLGNFLFSISFIKQPIYNKVEANVIAKLSGGAGDVSVEALLEKLGFPDFMNYILSEVVNDGINPEAFVETVSNGLSRLFLYVIAFVFLLFMMTFGIGIIKLLIKLLRKTSRLIKIIDGTLGVIFGVFIFLFLTYIALLCISIAVQVTGPNSDFTRFIIVDMQLESNTFRLSKLFYENNIIGNIFKLFFS